MQIEFLKFAFAGFSFVKPLQISFFQENLDYDFFQRCAELDLSTFEKIRIAEIGKILIYTSYQISSYI